jgi:hypothetical protein
MQRERSRWANPGEIHTADAATATSERMASLGQMATALAAIAGVEGLKTEPTAIKLPEGEAIIGRKNFAGQWLWTPASVGNGTEAAQRLLQTMIDHAPPDRHEALMEKMESYANSPLFDRPESCTGMVEMTRAACIAAELDLAGEITKPPEPERPGDPF